MKNIQERIFEAATKLYEENGKKRPPGVSEVRAEAKVNMQDASKFMKIWREENIQDANQEIPESILKIGNQAILGIWQQANQDATEALRAAKSTWDGERDQLNSTIHDISKICDDQTSDIQELKNQIETLQKIINDVNKSITESNHRADIAEKIKNEVEKRAQDLKAELDRAHKENNRLRNECEEARIQLSKANAMASKLSGRLETLDRKKL